MTTRSTRKFSNMHYTEMVRILAICQDNVDLACKAFEDKFGVKVSKQIMSNATNRLSETGNFNFPQAKKAKKSVDPEEKIERARKNGEPGSVVVKKTKTAKKAELKKPKIKLSITEQKILNADERLMFCEWFLQEPRNILWTGETVFNTACETWRNQYFWAPINARNIKFKPKKKPLLVLTAWAGIIGDTILGPIFFPKLTGDLYYKFLTEQLPQLVDTIPDDCLKDFYFQHDGSPPHIVAPVNEHLNNLYEDHWIGKNGPIKWPASSPDFNPVAFFIWDYVKAQVSLQNPQTVPELKTYIIEAFDKMKKKEVGKIKILQQQLTKKAQSFIKRHNVA